MQADCRKRGGFNTQPPEGGCKIKSHNPAYDDVSTHSRLKAAGRYAADERDALLFQHTAA